MTIAEMDLAYSPAHRLYEAPPHLKANGGTFMIDDFGRQRIVPEELLNRWIIPLEHRVDYLTLQAGRHCQATACATGRTSAMLIWSALSAGSRRSDPSGRSSPT